MTSTFVIVGWIAIALFAVCLLGIVFFITRFIIRNRNFNRELTRKENEVASASYASAPTPTPEVSDEVAISTTKMNDKAITIDLDADLADRPSITSDEGTPSWLSKKDAGQKNP